MKWLPCDCSQQALCYVIPCSHVTCLLQGGGIAYGTKEGKLRILRHDPRPEARTLATCQQPRGLEDELREAESIYEDDVLL